jgi:hypothetical protein
VQLRGWSTETAAGFRAQIWRVLATFLMVFFLIVAYPCSAYMVHIGASHSDGFNHMFYHVGTIVHRGQGAEGALARVLVLREKC